MREGEGSQGGHCCHGNVGPAAELVKAPVCGMDVAPGKSAGSLEHSGRTYHFCSRHCLEKFRAEPDRYTEGVGILRGAIAGYPGVEWVDPPTGR